jgi:hypothetical protein
MNFWLGKLMCENTKISPIAQVKAATNDFGTKFDIKIIINTYYTYCQND